jgi:deazaflavin-dependent oxidoreductase (nitroreductase family)
LAVTGAQQLHERTATFERGCVGGVNDKDAALTRRPPPNASANPLGSVMSTDPSPRLGVWLRWTDRDALPRRPAAGTTHATTENSSMSATKTTPPGMHEWQEQHLHRYLQSGGAEGHLYDFGPINQAGYQPICLIKHVGRKTGRTLILPLIYGMVEGEIVIVASKGGAPAHPAWYLNIAASSEVEVQVATQAFRATWREPAEAERARIWNQMVAIYPPYADYQQSTDRLIPLVMMKPVATIPTFKDADLDR